MNSVSQAQISTKIQLEGDTYMIGEAHHDRSKLISELNMYIEETFSLPTTYFLRLNFCSDNMS